MDPSKLKVGSEYGRLTSDGVIENTRYIGRSRGVDGHYVFEDANSYIGYFTVYGVLRHVYNKVGRRRFSFPDFCNIQWKIYSEIEGWIYVRYMRQVSDSSGVVLMASGIEPYTVFLKDCIPIVNGVELCQGFSYEDSSGNSIIYTGLDLSNNTFRFTGRFASVHHFSVSDLESLGLARGVGNLQDEEDNTIELNITAKKIVPIDRINVTVTIPKVSTYFILFSEHYEEIEEWHNKIKNFYDSDEGSGELEIDFSDSEFFLYNGTEDEVLEYVKDKCRREGFDYVLIGDENRDLQEYTFNCSLVANSD